MGVVPEPTIYYATFDAGSGLGPRLADAMKHLAEILSEPGIGLRIRVEPLPDHLRDPVRRILEAEAAVGLDHVVVAVVDAAMSEARPPIPMDRRPDRALAPATIGGCP